MDAKVRRMASSRPPRDHGGDGATRAGGTVNAMIVAEGAVQISGSTLTIGPDTAGQPALVSGAEGDDAIRLDGSRLQVQ